MIISSIAYMPMAFFFTDLHWLNLYLFSLQTRRIFLYLVFFIAGVFTGAYGVERTIFVSNSSLSKRCLLWLIAAIAAFILKWKIIPETDNPNLLITGSGSIRLLTSGFIYVLGCVTCSFAFIALFLKFIKNKNKVSDSLDINSYGIYIIHYPLVSWIQYSLLGTSLPPHLKGPAVFLSTLILCWLFITIVRRIPGVARII
jgi:surface polysaccharide O-acyltransferase-like enzyme